MTKASSVAIVLSLRLPKEVAGSPFVPMSLDLKPDVPSVIGHE
jgi:hypothetical protein